MKKHRLWVPAVVATAMVLGACGSDGGGGGEAFTDQLQTECRTMARGLRSIDAPVKVEDFEQAANDASQVYADGLTALKKLEAPKDQADDFKDLQTNFEDQVDVFDQIATAAKNGGAATVATKITSLTKITTDNAELADSSTPSPAPWRRCSPPSRRRRRPRRRRRRRRPPRRRRPRPSRRRRRSRRPRRPRRPRRHRPRRQRPPG